MVEPNNAWNVTTHGSVFFVLKLPLVCHVGDQFDFRGRQARKLQKSEKKKTIQIIR